MHLGYPNMKLAMQLAMKLALGSLVLCAVAVLMTTATFGALNANYYDISCPLGQAIVSTVVFNSIIRDKSLAAGLLRLHFHDCFVRGCDSSVMIVKANGTAERDGIPNKNSLRGFEVIEAAKAKLEKVCPKTFSCADIIAQAARDSVLATGGPGWLVQYGRRDGFISLATEANEFLPSPFSDFNTLVSKFAAKTLSAKQMVILSGSHTIGSGKCAIIQKRLYNFTGVGDTDPSFDRSYAAFLKTKCANGDLVTRQAMDPTSNGTFDNAYFTNVQVGRGFFTSDATLVSNIFGARYVSEEVFNYIVDFPLAMLAMGAIEVLTGSQGSIRTICSDPHS